MYRRLVRLIPLAAIVLGISACRDTLNATDSNFALFNLAATVDGADTTTRPAGLIFQGRGVLLSTSNVAIDQCETVFYPPQELLPDIDYLDAGTSILAQVSGAEAPMVPTVEDNLQIYALATGTSIPFTPGDTIRFLIDGPDGEEDAFPDMSVRAKTAEAFTPSPITIDPSATNAQIRWAPGPTSGGSYMFYEFRYATPSSLVINRSIACSFVDDGSVDMPPNELLEFNEATFRQVVATRVRISANRIGESVSHVTSTYQQPVTVTVLTP